MDSIIDSDIGFAGILPAIKKGETIVRDGKALGYAQTPTLLETMQRTAE